jgi:hypothetical protein
MGLIRRHKKSVVGLTEDILSINQNILQNSNNIDAEIQRAMGEEDSIRQTLSQEIQRSTDTDIQIQGDVGFLSGSLSTTQSDLDNLNITLTAAISQETNARVSSDNALQINIDSEVNARIAGDSALNNRVNAIEAGLVSGIVPKGSLQTLAELDLLDESTLHHGWAFYIRSLNDLYMYVDDTGGDYKPADFVTGSFIKFADYTELSSLVQTEQSRAISAELAITANLNSEINRAQSAELQIATDLQTEVQRAQAAESALEASKLTKTENLNDLQDKAVARTNLNVYSKPEVDNILLSGVRFINDVCTVQGDKITLLHRPKDDVVFFGVAEVKYIVGSNTHYDKVTIVRDVTDATYKTYSIEVGTPNEYDGAIAYVTYAYVA